MAMDEAASAPAALEHPASLPAPETPPSDEVLPVENSGGEKPAAENSTGNPISETSATKIRSVTVVATGDVYLGSWITDYLEKFGPDYPYKHTAGLLDKADIVMVNLESPITEANEPYVEKEFLLKSGPLATRSLVSAGVDVATLANNHMMDYAEPGLVDTLAFLDLSSIAYAGAGSNLKEAREAALIETEGGVSIAVLAFSNTFPKVFYAGKDSPGTAPGYAKYIKKDVARAAESADIVIVAFHWGAELTTLPKDYQVALAHLAIDSGADLVIGHHPHTVQPVEMYKGAAIFYSLGNFVFASYGSEQTEGALAEVVFESDGHGRHDIAAARIIPLDVRNSRVSFRPVPLEGERLTDALAEIESRSIRFKVVFDKFLSDGTFSRELVSAGIAP